MEHTKSTEVTHCIKVTAADIISMLNKPPRAVLVPAAAMVVVQAPDGEQFTATEFEMRISWKENGK